MNPDSGSTLNQMGMYFVLLMSVLLLVLPRRYAVIPFIVSTCYMTLGQWIYVAGMHFNVIRILVFVGGVRIVLRERFRGVNLNAIDKAVLTYLAVSLAIYALLYHTRQDIIEKLGYTYSDMGVYIILRCLVLGYEDVVRVIKQIAVLVVPLGVVMLVEVNTRTNMFYFLGGVPQFSEIRDNRVRCQGPFRHPILAGTFGATIFPFFVALVKDGLRSTRVVGIGGMLAASMIAYASGSSGPLMTYVLVIVAWMAWVMRHHMAAVRRSILASLIALHLVMKDPVWFIYARLSDYIGGTGWHRSYLINQAIVYFKEWWLIGTTYTAHWMPLQLPVNPNMVDITNQFILVGVNGGILSMALFILIIVRCFGTVGMVVKSDVQDRQAKYVAWGLGCALFGHVMSFMSVAYFDQLNVSWYLLIVMISAMSSDLLGTVHEVVEAGRGELAPVPGAL